jgi:putative ABC transport system permease protein
LTAHTNLNRLLMLKNYFRTAYKNFLNDKTSALISVLGLAVGMCCCMLIFIHIKDELSFNKFNTRLADIYRINWLTKDNSGENTGATTPIPFSNALTQKIPGIEKLTKLYQRSGQMESGKDEPPGKSDTKRFQEQLVFFSDPDLFSIFSIPFISGDPHTALASPNSIVITDEMARKYFGTADPLGKSLWYDNKALLRINGVVKKMPANSDLKFDFLVSFETLYSVDVPAFAEFIRNDWTFTPCETWISIRPGKNPAMVERALNLHLDQNGSPRNHKLNKVALQPLKDIHLYASQVVGNSSSSDITYIYIFAGIAFLILAIANINFINLSIARSISKIKEVGIRKVLGAEKKQLIRQFLGNSLVTSFIAFLLALMLTELALPLLNQLTGKQIAWYSVFSLPNIFLFVLIFFVTGILAGLYPAVFITRFNMILALKGKSGDQNRKNRIQKVLLVTQFAMSIVLIIGAVVIFRQLQYLRDKPLGFQKQQMLVVPIFGSGAFSYGLQIDAAMRHRMIGFSDELKTYSKIRDVTASSEMPGQGFVRGLIVPQGYSDQDNMFAPWLSVDYNFLQTLNMPLVAGRNFSKQNGTDFLNAFIINESAVRAFGWKTPEDAIGKTFVRGKLTDGKKGQIIGVVKDFDFNSLSNPMEPLVMDVNPPRFTEFAISIQPDHVSETIERIKRTWDRIFPERVFEYSFLDKDIDAQYKDKENFSRMIEYFALAAIILSCSGLFSLAFFLAVKRSKEIGIRKVLGADIARIVWLLSVDFIKLVFIASFIASPVAWWMMHNWLNGFAYHVRIEWWIFVFASLLALMLSFVTICFQSVRAALVNPIDSLRSE